MTENEKREKRPGELPRAVIYIRVGSAKQADRERAVVAQQHECQRRAAELGADVVREYVDVGSGAGFERPELTTMLGDMGVWSNEDARRVSYVIAYDNARIARDAQTYMRVVWEVERAGAQVSIASVPLVEYEAVAGRGSEVVMGLPEMATDTACRVRAKKKAKGSEQSYAKQEIEPQPERDEQDSVEQIEHNEQREV